MDNTNTIYTKQEQRLLNEFKNLKSLNFNKNFFLLLSFGCFYNTIKDIIKLIKCINNNDFEIITFFIIFILIDFILSILIIKKYFQYRNLIIKYNRINDPNKNPLANLCIQKIAQCKNLIKTNSNFYTVQNSYLDLRNFLEKYKESLPIETYDNAQKELKLIEFQMIYCDAKR